VTAGFAQVAGRAMRRQSGAVVPAGGPLVFSVSNPSTVRLADVVAVRVVPVPPVPPTDPRPHAEPHAGAWQRAVVLDLGLFPPSPDLTYEGRDVVIVRL
jgi:hypothetical protein